MLLINMKRSARMHSKRYFIANNINQNIFIQFLNYRMRSIMTRSFFETAFNFKPRILEQKIEEYPFFSTKIVFNIKVQLF